MWNQNTTTVTGVDFPWFIDRKFFWWLITRAQMVFCSFLFLTVLSGREKTIFNHNFVFLMYLFFNSLICFQSHVEILTPINKTLLRWLQTNCYTKLMTHSTFLLFLQMHSPLVIYFNTNVCHCNEYFTFQFRQFLYMTILIIEHLEVFSIIFSKIIKSL